jgi:hypothetical protein
VTQKMLEKKLRRQLLADARHPSRRQLRSDGMVVIRPSGTACGLAYAISALTGEDDDVIMNRVVSAADYNEYLRKYSNDSELAP